MQKSFLIVFILIVTNTANLAAKSSPWDIADKIVAELNPGIGYDFFWPDFAFTALTGRKSIDSYCTEVLRLPGGYFRTNSTEISVFFIM